MGSEPSAQSPRLLFITAFGLVYLYFALSVRSILSGLPGLVLMSIFCAMGSDYILYPLFSITAWITIAILSFWKFPVLRQRLAPIRAAAIKRKNRMEEKVKCFSWPTLDFDGRGFLAIEGSSLDFSNMSLTLRGINLTYEVDQFTKVVAKLDTVSVRLARDIMVGELYLNVKGDGLPASELMSFASVTKSPTASPTSSSTTTTLKRSSGESSRSVNSIKQTPTRKLPPMTPPSSLTRSPSKTAMAPQGPPLPPRLPPRSTIDVPNSNEIQAMPVDDETDLEKEEMRLAIEASKQELSGSDSSYDLLREGGEIDRSSARPSEGSSVLDSRSSIEADRSSTVKGDNLFSTASEHSSAVGGSSSITPDTSYFYPENEDTDDAFMQATFEEGAIDNSFNIDSPELNESDIKAGIAASLEDNASLNRNTKQEKKIKLSHILAKIPWWLRIDLGSLVTRLLLSVVAWSHPVRITSIAANGTGKRITNLMETGGLKKAHPNQEIFKLIRKVFLWLESGDISIILSNISIHPHIPISSDHDIMVDVKASEPTAYRNVTGTDDVLAKIDGIKGSFRIPTFLLPNHESHIPKHPRSTIPFSILLSLPGVFNRELLTIGAAFVKATTMMDLRHTAQNRAPPTLPSLTGTEKFSFRSFGLAVKQAAGDMAKQKGVQWGVRDAELAKWTAKFAGLMKVMRVDIGGAGEIPVDLYKLRRKASLKVLKKQSTA